MDDVHVTPEDLLAGSALTFDVPIPREILYPGDPGTGTQPTPDLVVQLRPITIGTFQLIMKAARNDAGLIPLLMIKESLVHPVLTLEQIKRMHLGLVNFLIAHIRAISGLTEKKSSLTE